jgi:hypothetical protein
MDQVFAQLALQTVNFMSKAAIGVATNLAVRRIQSVVNNRRRIATVESTPDVPEQRMTEVANELALIDRLNASKVKLERKMAALGPAFDLLERWDRTMQLTNIRALVDWARDIKSDVDRLNTALMAVDSTGGLVSGLQRASIDAEATAVVANAPSVSKSAIEQPGADAEERASIATTQATNDIDVASIVGRLESIVGRLDEICPFLQLALTVNSGSNSSTPQPQQQVSSRSPVSLGRMLAASKHLHLAHYKQQSSGGGTVELEGIQLTVCLYKLCIGSVKRHSAGTAAASFNTPRRTPRHHNSTNNTHTPTAASVQPFDPIEQQWQWQEFYPRCHVRLYLLPPAPTTHRYQLIFEQDKNDGRYHEHPERRTAVEYELTAVEKMFYADSGKLLRLTDSTQPCLVMKLQRSNIDSSALTATTRSNSQPPHTPVKSSSTMPAEYFALELIRANDNSDSTDDENDEESSELSDESGVDDANDNSSEDAYHASPSRGRSAAKQQQAKSRLSQRRKVPTQQRKSPKQRVPPKVQVNSSDSVLRQQLAQLSLFDYTMRLCMLEMSQQKPIEELADDKLLLELANN